jgi:hypothetical protein
VLTPSEESWAIVIVVVCPEGVEIVPLAVPLFTEIPFTKLAVPDHEVGVTVTVVVEVSVTL